MPTLKNASQQIFAHSGESHDYDWYIFTNTTPLSTQEVSVYVDFQNQTITGDKIAYGSWDDIDKDECMTLLNTLAPQQILRDFSHFA